MDNSEYPLLKQCPALQLSLAALDSLQGPKIANSGFHMGTMFPTLQISKGSFVPVAPGEAPIPLKAAS